MRHGRQSFTTIKVEEDALVSLKEWRAHIATHFPVVARSMSKRRWCEMSLSQTVSLLTDLCDTIFTMDGGDAFITDAMFILKGEIDNAYIT